MITGCVLAFAAQAAPIYSDPQYLGLYFNGHKLGYEVYRFGPCVHHGHEALQGNVVMESAATGALRRHSLVFFEDPAGRLLDAIYDDEGETGSEHMTVEFNGDTMRVTRGDGGATKTFPMPTDGTIVVDSTFAAAIAPAGVDKAASHRFYFLVNLDPPTLLPMTFADMGPTKLSIKGQEIAAHWIKAHFAAPGKTNDFATTMVAMMNRGGDVYLGDGGRLVKTEIVASMEVVAEPREVAISGLETGLKIPGLICIKASGEVPVPYHMTEMKISLAADGKLAAPPSDDHQTATRAGSGWTLDIHPPTVRESAGVTMVQAAAMQPEWVKPDKGVRSDSPRAVEAARKAVGKETDVLKATRAIQRYVSRYLRYDLNPPLNRNSDDVLTSRRGVCFDYALLSAALLRAAGIPARLVAGLTTIDGEFGNFYGHAWVQVFDGAHWVGIETTTREPNIAVDASYIELAAGSFEEFTGNSVVPSSHTTLKVLSVN